MHIMNYARFIREKSNLLKKIQRPTGGERPPHRPLPFESATECRGYKSLYTAMPQWEALCESSFQNDPDDCQILRIKAWTCKKMACYTEIYSYFFSVNAAGRFINKRETLHSHAKTGIAFQKLSGTAGRLVIPCFYVML